METMIEPIEIMTPKHPRWDEFYERLEGPEGCDFQEDSNGKITWKCGGGNNRQKSKAILANMGFDVQASLDYFTEHGGHWDCEILFNVEE